MRIEHAGPQPAGYLPVAARPAMLPLGVRVVISRIVIEKFDVADQRRARENRFKQIVAQQGLIGNSLANRLLEGIDVVESFAGIDAFVKQVLVNVRRSGGVRIDTGVAGKDPGKD